MDGVEVDECQVCEEYQRPTKGTCKKDIGRTHDGICHCFKIKNGCYNCWLLVEENAKLQLEISALKEKLK